MKEAAINCARSQAPTLVEALKPSLMELLEGDKPNWQGDLDIVLSNLGDVAACSLKDVVSDIEDKLTNLDVAKATAPARIVKNGKDVLKAKNYRFVEVDEETPPNL